MFAPEGAAGFIGATAMGGALPAEVPGAPPGVVGPETIGAEGGAFCVGAVGEVVELGGVDGTGGGDDEQPARSAAAPASDRLDK